MKVVKDWVWELPLRMQSTLLLALRGPDGTAKEGPAKRIVREYRYVVLVPAFPMDIFPKDDDVFMGTQTGYLDAAAIKMFKSNHDEYPHHWLMHLIHAAEIVGQFHPDDDTRAFWWAFYLEMCDAMHMLNENIDMLSNRLADPEWVKQADTTALAAAEQGRDARTECLANISDAIAEHCARHGDADYHGRPLDACVQQLLADYQHAHAEALAAEQGRQEAEQELRSVDAVLARRPALDLPTRRENIEKAISFAARTDEAERCLQAATRRAEAAEARELEQARQWQPIETAPRDATWILGVSASGDVRRVHYASDLSGSDQPAFQGWFYGVEDSRGRIVRFESWTEPTHWMPLPPPPDALLTRPAGEERTK